MKKVCAILMFFAALMTAALLAAACGDDDAPPTPVPTVTPAPTTAAASTPALAESASPAAANTATPVAISPLEVAASQPNVAASLPNTINELITGTVASAVICPVEPNTDFVGYEDVTGRLGCPLAEGSFGPVAINEFGSGPDYDRFMLWFSDERQIYVLEPDHSWLAYTDTWEEGEPEISCNPDNEATPESPPLPRRGFGKLWCTVEGVRETMGTIDREERLCQHAVVQRFERGRLLACFEDATIRYFRILDDGSWDMEMVQ